MRKRFPIAVALLAVLAALTSWAYQSAQLYVVRAGLDGSEKYHLLFNTATLAIPVALLLGVFLGTLGNHEENTKIVDGKIERHSELMFIQHWPHAIGTVILIITGMKLGTLFIPRSFQGAVKAGFTLNLHFVGVLLFFFGASFYVTRGLLTGEFKHMLPQKGDIKGSIDHVLSMFGKEPPKEEKFMSVERIIFPFWIFGVSGITLTGIVKVITHIWSLPGALMGIITPLHGFFAIYMALLLVAHVVGSALVPVSWPLIRSMITGYVTEDYVKHHHAKWYDELQAQNANKDTDDSQDAEREVASSKMEL